MANLLRGLFGKSSGKPKAESAPDGNGNGDRWVIIGLGNPGEKYAGTRHNVGFQCIDLLAQRAGIRLKDKRQHAELGQGTLAGAQVVLVKPRTFMNRSGVAAKYLKDRFGVRPANMLVVVDDMDLPVGKMRLRASGGTGGHNGLKSINEELGTQDYPRLRIGVGRPSGNAIGHVLGGFSAEEESMVRETLQRAAETVETCVEQGVEQAMNRYNS